MKDVSNRGTGYDDVNEAADALESVVFAFEDIVDLELLPLAARRALDVAGYRLPLEGWRIMTLEDRRDLTLEGGREVVDPARVGELLRSAKPAATRIRPVPDPDPLLPPEQLPSFLGVRRPIDPAQWTRLRALDRYALVHVLRRSIAHDDPRRLETALAAILPKGSVRPADRATSARPGARSAAPIATQRSTNKRADAREDTPSLRDVRGRSAPASRSRSEPPGERETSPGHRSYRTRELGDDDGLEAAFPLSSGHAPERSTLQPELDDEAAIHQGHFSASGDARMVDVGEKAATHRRAVASGCIHMMRSTAERIIRGEVPKGEALAVARVAGIMAAKRTADIIPLCHTIPLTRVEVHLSVDAQRGRVLVEVEAEAHGPTGVEMEALTATSAACLALYDMLKAFDRDMTITDIKLLEKSGGRRGTYTRDE